MIERILKNYNEENLNELNNLSIEELFKNYVKICNPYYLLQYSNVSSVASRISEIIINKMKDSDIVGLIQLYSELFNQILYTENTIESCQNIINVRKINLQDDFYINYVVKQKGVDKDEFLVKYKDELKSYFEDYKIFKKSFELLDQLQEHFLIEINKLINNLSLEDRKILIVSLNEKIEENSKKILLINRSIKIKKIADVDLNTDGRVQSDTVDKISLSNLKNNDYIYSSFRNTLLNKNEKNKGK